MRLICILGFVSLFMLIKMAIVREVEFQEAEFSVIRYATKINSILKTFNEILLPNCIINCIMIYTCQSINYNMILKTCQLSDKNSSSGSLVTQSHGWSHLETRTQVINSCNNVLQSKGNDLIDTPAPSTAPLTSITPSLLKATTKTKILLTTDSTSTKSASTTEIATAAELTTELATTTEISTTTELATTQSMTTSTVILTLTSEVSHCHEVRQQLGSYFRLGWYNITVGGEIMNVYCNETQGSIGTLVYSRMSDEFSIQELSISTNGINVSTYDYWIGTDYLTKLTAHSYYRLEINGQIYHDFNFFVDKPIEFATNGILANDPLMIVYNGGNLWKLCNPHSDFPFYWWYCTYKYSPTRNGTIYWNGIEYTGSKPFQMYLLQ